MKTLLLLAALVVPSLALAQVSEPWAPPPLVPAAPPPPPPEPPPVPPPAPTDAPVVQQPGTPAPPSYTPNSRPTGYQYSPYGNARPTEKPPVEVGLMVSESLFGALTGAAVCVLPYFLLGLNSFASDQNSGIFGDNATIGTVIFLLIFGAVPLAVAQTEVSLANGSRHYYAEAWPAMLAGLVAEGAILGLGYALKGQPFLDTNMHQHTPIFNGTFVLVATIAAVPLIQMAVINLFKTDRSARSGAGYGALSYDPEHGLRAGIPMAAPTVGQTRFGTTYGVQASLLSGRF